MAQESAEDRHSRAVDRATALVTKALDLLDAHADCADASAHLELALGRLRHYEATKARE